MKPIQPQDLEISRWLPSGIGLDDIIAGLAALATLATIFGLWQALRPKDAFERWLAQIIENREGMRRQAVAARPRQQLPRTVGLMRAAVTRLNLLRSQHAAEARLLLARAGRRSPDAMIAFLFARLSLPMLCAVAMLLVRSLLDVLPLPHELHFVPAVGAALLGFYAPKLYLSNAAAKRAKKLQLALPDGLDLMVICAEAGLSLDATLVRVSRELAGSFPELAEELAITAAELTFLPDRRAAFDNLNNRTDCEGIRAIVNTMQQTAKFGTPLAQSLRILSAESRAARLTRAEEKAAKLPAILTVPMIVFILPTLFIVLLGPAVINIMDTIAKK
jgi:tight adherence protein C